MRVLLDTNVVLDHLLERPAWLDQAAAIWDASEDGRLDSFIAATTLTTVYYVARKERSMADRAGLSRRVERHQHRRADP